MITLASFLAGFFVGASALVWIALRLNTAKPKPATTFTAPISLGGNSIEPHMAYQLREVFKHYEGQA